MSTRMARHPNTDRGSDAGSPPAAEAGKPNSGAAHISADATICFSRAQTLTQRAGREANLIVIAHPNQSMLGRRFRVSAENLLSITLRVAIHGSTSRATRLSCCDFASRPLFVDC